MIRTNALPRAIEIIARMIVWLLITTSFNPENLLIGLFISITLPPISNKELPTKALFTIITKIPNTIFNAYKEAFLFIMNGYKDRPRYQKVKTPHTFKGNKILRFFWTMHFTITPGTIVVEEDKASITIRSQLMR